MGFSEKLKEFGDKAQGAAAEHRDEIMQAVQTAGTLADQRTGGRHRDRILKATQRAGDAVDRVAGQPADSRASERREGPETV